MGAVTVTSPWTNYNAWRASVVLDKTGVTTEVNQRAEESVVATNFRLKRTTNSDPGWRTKVAKHVDASQYYFVSSGTVFVNRTKVKFTKQQPGYPNTWTHGNIYASCVRSIPDFSGINATDTGTSDAALGRLKSRLATWQGDKNVLAPIGELRELRQLITGTADLTARTLIDIVNLKTKYRGGTLAKRAANAWLTWVFGIKPMLSDITAANQSIAAFLNREDANFRLSGSAAKRWISVVKPGEAFGFPVSEGVQWNSTISWSHSIQYKYKAGFYYFLKAANDYSILDQLHLNWQGIPSAAYELSAYSWMLDYFGTIGAFMDDAFFTPQGQSYYVILDRKYIASGRQFWTPSSPWPYVKFTEGSGYNDVRYFEFERTPLSALPRRALRFKSIDEVGKSGINKVLNLASILTKHIGWSQRFLPEFASSRMKSIDDLKEFRRRRKSRKSRIMRAWQETQIANR